METTQLVKTRAYPKYKDSGVEWLGEIPEHWEVFPLFALTELKSITNCVDEELLSIYLDKGVIRFSDVTAKRTNVTSLDLSKYQLVEEGDFVLNNQQAWRGSVGVSIYKGIVSPAYIVLKLRESLNPSFANYLFRDGSMVSQYLINSKGVGTIQRNLYWPSLRRSSISLPPLPEQIAIANFLDDKTEKIDQAIRIKEQQIALLKERKQILIHKAVTRGLDDSVPLKDSGVEWIGEIPEHWEVKKLGFLTKKIGDGLHGTPNYTTGTEYHFINGNNLSTGNIVINEQTNTVSEKDYLSNKKDLSKQTLLLSINGTIGNVAFYNGEKVMLGKSAAYLNFHEDVNIEYIKYFLESPIFKNYYELELSGSTIYNLSLYSIRKTPVIFPSSREQSKIVSYIKNANYILDKAITLKQQEIEKLQEYKRSLVNGVVTGKVRVC